MNTAVDNAISSLASWFGNQPRWLQHAARAILNGGKTAEKEIHEYSKSAISEVMGELVAPDTNISFASLGAVQTGETVSLVSISNVSGVGQIKTRNPLNFGNERIVIVFGSNGSGKSSYVRILKHACGARQKGEIHGNVFDQTVEPQSCAITFRGTTNEKTVQWTASGGIIRELSTIDIFDTLCGHSYLATEGQPTYEPQLLLFLSQLAALCDQVAARLVTTISAKVKALPVLPTEHSLTVAGKWYEGLTSNTQQTAINVNCSWAEVDDVELLEVGKYLTERSPKDRAKELT